MFKLLFIFIGFKNSTVFILPYTNFYINYCKYAYNLGSLCGKKWRKGEGQTNAINFWSTRLDSEMTAHRHPPPPPPLPWSLDKVEWDEGHEMQSTDV